MLRFLTLAALLIGAILLTHGVAQAQDADLPVAGPDETIILGEVPDAPRGTDVWAEYLVIDGDFVACGHTTADEYSRFVLVVDAGCATPLGPAVCWAELPDQKAGPEELCDSSLSPVWGGDPPDAGETVDMGLLVRPLVPGQVEPVPSEPTDDYPREIDFPVAGPDEIIFVGEVPAPPGTDVWATYLIQEIVSCGHTQADVESRFVLVVDAACGRFQLGPLICWGEKPVLGQSLESCEGFPRLMSSRPEGGDTIDVGLLDGIVEPLDFPGNITPPHGDSGSILPAVGRTAAGSGGNHEGMWLSIALLLAAALVAGVGSLALRRGR